MNKHDLIQQGVGLLDQVTVSYLDFTKTYKRAKEVLNDVDVEKTNYFIGKLRSFNKDFASLYCNLDGENRRIILDAFYIYYDEKPDLKYNTQESFVKYMTEMDRVTNDKDYISFWQLFNFHVKFLDKWLILAFNNNPETLLTELSPGLWKCYKKTKIENFGSAKNWAKFWVWLRNNDIKQRKIIVEEIITNPFRF